MTQEKNIKIVFWGTPEFALPALEALMRNGYNIITAVANPDQPVGRKQILTPPPVKVFAQKYKIPVSQPETLKTENCKLKIPEADIYIVAAYGKIIPKEIIDSPKYGSLNIHPSLLPRWRGPSPIQYTILSGDTETGVTIIKMDELMDHGPIIKSSKLKVQNSKLTYQKLHDKLAKLGAGLLIETLPKWLAGEIKPVTQNEAEVTYSKILKKDDGRVDWSWPAEKIERMMRAFHPWPGTWTTWPSDKGVYRIRIDGAEVIRDEYPQGPLGYTWGSPQHPLLVKTGQESLAISRLTLEGKKTLDIKSFLRGHNLLGTILI